MSITSSPPRLLVDFLYRFDIVHLWNTNPYSIFHVPYFLFHIPYSNITSDSRPCGVYNLEVCTVWPIRCTSHVRSVTLGMTLYPEDSHCFTLIHTLNRVSKNKPLEFESLMFEKYVDYCCREHTALINSVISLARPASSSQQSNSWRCNQMQQQSHSCIFYFLFFFKSQSRYVFRTKGTNNLIFNKKKLLHICFAHHSPWRITNEQIGMGAFIIHKTFATPTFECGSVPNTIEEPKSETLMPPPTYNPGLRLPS